MRIMIPLAVMLASAIMFVVAVIEVAPMGMMMSAGFAIIAAGVLDDALRERDKAIERAMRRHPAGRAR